MLTHSTLCNAGASTGESGQGSSPRDGSGRPEMAQSVLARQAVRTASRLSFGHATDGRSAVPVPQPPDTTATASGVSTSLEAVKRSLTERGFSKAAVDQISRGRRQSSRAVYNSKFEDLLWLVRWAIGGSSSGFLWFFSS